MIADLLLTSQKKKNKFCHFNVIEKANKKSKQTEIRILKAVSWTDLCWTNRFGEHFCKNKNSETDKKNEKEEH